MVEYHNKTIITNELDVIKQILVEKGHITEDEIKNKREKIKYDRKLSS